MSKIVDRLKEGSTHAGLAAVVSGIGMILHSPETATVAAKIPAVAERVVAQDYIGAAMVLFGTLAVFIKDKK